MHSHELVVSVGPVRTEHFIIQEVAVNQANKEFDAVTLKQYAFVKIRSY